MTIRKLILIAAFSVAIAGCGSSGPYWKDVNPNSLVPDATTIAVANQGSGSASYEWCRWDTPPFFQCYNALLGSIDDVRFKYLPNGYVTLAS